LAIPSLPDDLDVFRVPEYDAVRAALGDDRGLRVLDAGCGDGEFARLAAHQSFFVGLDYRIESLLHARARYGADARLICADATRLPISAAAFDAAICTAVLSHLRSSEERAALLREMARVLRPGGKLVITAMHFNFRFRRKGISKEGYDEGVFYRKYEVDEFRSELAAHFEVVEIWGLWNYLPKTYRLYVALGKSVVHWERFFRRRKASLKYGKILLAICRTCPPKCESPW
jgi:ubiquinone/menaquinone biosynthesis C-methylase UbiE